MSDIFSPEEIAGHPYHLVDRGCGTVLLHDTLPAWIVHYPAINNVRREFYQAYKSCAHIPKGREPWTVDNKAIGNREHGFLTLSDAIEAVRRQENG